MFGPEDNGSVRTYVDVDTGDIIVVNNGNRTIQRIK